MDRWLLIAFEILAFVLWSWAISDVTRSRFKKSNMKILWFMAVLLIPVFGSIIYFQFKKKFVLRKRREFQPDFHRTQNEKS
jgi:hypothetical protein